MRKLVRLFNKKQKNVFDEVFSRWQTLKTDNRLCETGGNGMVESTKQTRAPGGDRVSTT